QHLLHGKIIWRSAIARSRQTVSGFNRISSPASEAGLKAPTDAGPGLFALDVMAAGRLIQKQELLLSRFTDQGHRTAYAARLHVNAAVHVEHLASDVSRVRRTKKQHWEYDILYLPKMA